MQIVPQIMSCFNISRTRLLALQCSKKLTNRMTLTENSLLPKSTSSASTKSPLQAGNLTCFWRGHGQKIPLRMHQSTPFQVKIRFFWEGDLTPSQTSSPVGKGIPPHTRHLDPLLPHQAFCIRPSVPIILARFTSLVIRTADERWRPVSLAVCHLVGCDFPVC